MMVPVSLGVHGDRGTHPGVETALKEMRTGGESTHFEFSSRRNKHEGRVGRALRTNAFGRERGFTQDGLCTTKCHADVVRSLR